MSIEEELRAVRTSVALSEPDHVTPLRLSGADAFATLDRVCPKELFLRDGQIQHGLFLNEDATPFVDVYIARDDDAFYLLAEGASPEALVDYLKAHAEPATDIAALDGSHGLLSLNGPFAWELLAEVVGAALLGVPYLNFCHVEDLTCFRAGKTGEYGYDLLVPADKLESVRAAVLEAGTSLDLGLAGLAALDQCALENRFFNIRREARAGLTPLELQMQARVSRRKEGFVGAEALRARREAGVAQRITSFVADTEVADDATVHLDGEAVGQVLAAGFSPLLDRWIGCAMLRRDVAVAGIDGFSTGGDGSTAALTTIAPPALTNASLLVNPRKHSYATRDEIKGLSAGG
jgi:aminomethyltransferase